MRKHTDLLRTVLATALVAAVYVPTSMYAQGGAPQTIQTAPGTKIPYNVVANQIRQPLAGNLTPQQFAARLNAGGTLSLDGPDLIIGPADFSHNSVFFLALDTLELKNHARIITNGNTLVVFVNHLISEDGSVLTFTPDNVKAAAGGAGAPGSPGVPGRLVSIHVINDLTGIVHFDLSGQSGGDGGNGAGGAAGQPGVKGNAASSGPFGCNMGGGNGSPGAQGGIGGRGGDGGAGGAGAELELFNVSTSPIPVASYTFVAKAGMGGSPGVGGPGGPGGHGGDGGDGSGFCSGGSPGPNGAPGPQGPSGVPGAVPNGGDAIVKNIDLQFILNHEIPGLTNQH